jgi:hypothetical protein
MNNDPKQFKELVSENDILVSSNYAEVLTDAPKDLNIKVLSSTEKYGHPMLASRADIYVQIFQSLASEVGVYLALRITEALISEATRDLYINYIKKPFLRFLKKHNSDTVYESRPGGIPVNMLIQLTPEILLELNFLNNMDEEDYENAFKNLPLFLSKMKELNPSINEDLDSIRCLKKLFCYFDNKKKEWFVESWAAYDAFSEITNTYVPRP